MGRVVLGHDRVRVEHLPAGVRDSSRPSPLRGQDAGELRGKSPPLVGAPAAAPPVAPLDLAHARPRVVGQFDRGWSSRPAMSVSVHTWSVTPAAIAGVVR